MRFNRVVKEPVTITINVAGGEAYKESTKLEFVSTLLTSFVADTFYRKAEKGIKNFEAVLLGLNDWRFAAKAAIYARTKYGMRSITHIVAANIVKHTAGLPWVKNFISRVIHRPDDAIEILAYYQNKNGKNAPISNALKKGIASAFDKFDSYQIAKYKAETHALKLIDVVNLVHPKPTERNANALKALAENKLISTETWEAMLSAAGSDKDRKAAVWGKLIVERKLGYFALLRNLRNILEQASPAVVALAAETLVDKNLISKSLVLPFRFLTARAEIEKLSENGVRKILGALATATELALDNVPVFEGKTAVIFDVSGSMTQHTIPNSSFSPARVGALFAAALYKRNPNADLIVFDGTARFLTLNGEDSLSTLAQQLELMATGGNTNFHAPIKLLKVAYDRLIFISDMQGWVGFQTPVRDFREYERKFNIRPFVHSFNLMDYGTLMFPEDRICAIAGFSDEAFKVMGLIETDKNALVNEIEKISLEDTPVLESVKVKKETFTVSKNAKPKAKPKAKTKKKK